MSPESIGSIITVVLASNWVGQLILYKVQQRDSKKDNLKKGVCALLRNEIVASHRLYTRMGFCPYADKQNVKDLYDAYHGLGGNDIATSLKNEILSLPLERERRDYEKQDL